MCRYASLLSDGDKTETKTEKHQTSEEQDSGRRRKFLEHSDSKGSMASTIGSVNESRIAALADLMSVFVDENECSSDQDDMMNELQEIGYIVTPKSRDIENRKEGFEFSAIQKTQASSQSVDAGTKSVESAENLPVATDGRIYETELYNQDMESTVESAVHINVYGTSLAVSHKAERDKSTSDINSLGRSLSNLSFATCSSGDLELAEALATVPQTLGLGKVMRRAVENEETAILTRTKENKKDLLYLDVPVPKRTISAGILDLIESRRKPVCEDGSIDSDVQAQSSYRAMGRNTSFEPNDETNKQSWNIQQRSTISKRTGLYDVGVVELTLQYLIVTERLKVQILHVGDLANFSSSFSSNMFVQVSLMPCKMQKQTSKSVKSSTNPDFAHATFYFSGISLTDMHLMTVRVQVMQRKHLFQIPKCIAEMSVALDGIDLVGETILRECLRI